MRKKQTRRVLRPVTGLLAVAMAGSLALSTHAYANSEQQTPSEAVGNAIDGDAIDGDAIDVELSRICELNSDIRAIELVRLVPSQATPCAVQQRRPQGRETLWRAENDYKYCERKYSAYLARLSSLGFDCGNVKPSSLERAAAGFDDDL